MIYAEYLQTIIINISTYLNDIKLQKSSEL